MSEPMDMTPADVLRAAADRIANHGWYRGGLGDWAGDGPCCAVGAIWAASGVQPESRARDRADEAWMACESSLGVEAAGLAYWNDRRATSADDVVFALLIAADEWEARHARP